MPKPLKIYVVIHSHRFGVTVNAFKTEESAENCAFHLKCESAKEFGIDLDEALEADNLDAELCENGESVSIEESELQ